MHNRSDVWQRVWGILLVSCLLIAPVRGDISRGNIDRIVLGDAASERDHNLQAQNSDIVQGGLSEPARRLLPLKPQTFDGGWISFTMKVDPQEQNYVTAKFWGSDKGQGAGRLVLYANGLQVGYRREGDYDVLNQCDEEGEAPDRFLYQTLPLPPLLTRGKTSVTLKIAALGPMWYYGATFAQYQKNLTEPSRGIYRVYTHTESRFAPDGSEKQGQFPDAVVRPGPGEEVIAKSKQIVINRLDRLLQETTSSQHAIPKKDYVGRLWLLAEAYNTPWTPAFHDDRAIELILQDGDAMAADFHAGPSEGANGWIGTGPLGEAIMRTWPAIGKRLDETIVVDGKSLKRRAVWASALRRSVDFWRTHRRNYTNQSMIVDWNIYTANRALQLIDPEQSLPENWAIHLLYQAVGLEPWLGSDKGDGSEKPFGENYYLVTRKGLSRELGWVGSYGETILHFTCDMARLTGDEKLRQQLAKLERARMYFRYPGVDADGYRCMKLVSEVDNRTAHYPLSGSAYTAPGIREEWWTDVPALLSDDSVAVGAFQQALADNQYFAYVDGRLKDPDTLGMMRNVDDYAKVKALPPSTYRLPMTDGQPDFAFADEEDAIVAIKHGEDRLFVNLYYRAERAVNSAARIYEVTPTITRIATVRTDTQVIPSGHTYTRPDWIDSIRTKGMPPPGEDIHEAWAGDQMPISARPPGASLPTYDDWGPFLGKASLYVLRYGDYFIAMNSSYNENYDVSIPADVRGTIDLITSRRIEKSSLVKLGPLTTIVLQAGGGAEAAQASQ